MTPQIQTVCILNVDVKDLVISINYNRKPRSHTAGESLDGETFFMTRVQKRHHGSGTSCWRKCGSDEAKHYHLFRDCPKPSSFWRDSPGVYVSINYTM